MNATKSLRWLPAVVAAVALLGACSSSSSAATPTTVDECKGAAGVYNVTFTKADDAGADCPPLDPTTWTVNADGTAGANLVPAGGTAVVVSGPNGCDMMIDGLGAPVCGGDTKIHAAPTFYGGTQNVAGVYSVDQCGETCPYKIAGNRDPFSR